ncbi:putative bifunctional diguanylate cyclase/phosphodiesterase [Kineococcus gynurae]|uniref:Bifunctional diguanylate cyclase/phosphodiesterase n=1 Tax=Kineococcus gynurae TaxID=452979 RepID=A0ABV5LUN5_9ACTN
MTRTAPVNPGVADPHVRAVFVATHSIGNALVLTLVTALGLSADPVAVAVLRSVALALLVLGALSLVRGSAWRPRSFHVVTVGLDGLILVAVLTCTSPVHAVVLASGYGLVGLTVMFLAPSRRAVPQVLLAGVLAPVALGLRPDVPLVVVVVVSALYAATVLTVAAVLRIAVDASYDSLTGLLNRRGFETHLETRLHGLPRREPLVAAFVDVDFFKTVNDGQGHAAGDALLQAVAAQCAAALPAGAVVARHGGDEFAVLLPGHDGEQALAVLDEVRRAVTCTTVSVGLAERAPDEDATDLLRRADRALYTAKLTGRDRCVLDDLDNVDLTRDLARALAAGEVRAWLQPIVSPQDGSVSGWEALARWEHPTRGPVPPNRFIPLAESTGLIHELGSAILADACRAANQIRLAWRREFLLTVNVSGRQLTAPGYAEGLFEILRETGFPADLLVVEVTESLLDGTSLEALRALEALRRRGVCVAIDDFGTGYSAFSRLDVLPADYLKLDQEFIAGITTSPRRAAMLQALLQLAHALGIAVIAEGVETREQGDMLAGFGCPLVQGYHFGRPVDPADVLDQGPKASDASVQALTLAAARWAARASWDD